MWCCAALAVVSTPALLFAHARLVRSTPAANARLDAAPAGVSLWFSERPELRFTTIELVDSAGTRVTLGAISPADSMGVSAPIAAALHPGRYSIAWRTAAADGHGTSGRFSFVLAPAGGESAAGMSPTAPSDSRSDSSRNSVRSNTVVQRGGESGYSIPVRWAELIAAITLIGAVVFRLFVLPRAEWPVSAASDGADRARRLASAVLLLFAIASIMRLVAESDLMPGVSTGRGVAILSMVKETGWGHGWLFSAAGALIVFAGLVTARRVMTGWIVAGVGVVGICLGEALTGHAGSMTRHLPLAISVDVAHFLGAGGWLGGLACVVVCGLPALRVLDEGSRHVAGARLVRGYHRAAMECVVLVIATALVAAWLRLNAVSELWTTEYGSMLFRKIVFVLIMMAFGFYHWRTTVVPEWTSGTARRFRLSAAGELVVGAIIVAFTTLLVSTALPPRP